MWIADGWKDYEVIDTSCGEKLERWGIIFWWGRIRRLSGIRPRWIRAGSIWTGIITEVRRAAVNGSFDLPEQWDIHYKGLTFNLKPFSFKHTGLFPEQAVNWDWFGNKIRNAGRPVKVLNLLHIQVVRLWRQRQRGLLLLMWMLLRVWLPGQRRMRLLPVWEMLRSAGWWMTVWSLLSVRFAEESLWCDHYGSAFLWTWTEGEIWKIEDCIHDLIKLCTKILSDEPLFFLINSYTTGLAPAVLTYMLSTELKKFGRRVDSQEIGLPVSSNGLVLPCGASGRWEVINS